MLWINLFEVVDGRAAVIINIVRGDAAPVVNELDAADLLIHPGDNLRAKKIQIRFIRVNSRTSNG